MNHYISWRKQVASAGLVILGFALPITTSFAAPSQSAFCRTYAHDYSLRYSAGGALGGVVRGAVGGRPSMMRGLQTRWLYNHAYENCMSGRWP
jgi:hypothetical protein